ncbi:putative ATP-grasp-modified RiPP [Saccharopolyspora phatthalungensis]|uniref:Putative ATP-grasp target RiPP n=1 Tax=Saccharopolyspora phatthalungensis TaxID=664693 RepID=A0A840QH65_9PSEU|nr:putative ATP-grasp-modified RiPP [Saccharopolyspora phatthalungensis]MBB5159471.1 putative ATP-grasp target RiPP [Saccharopolyspora phatthalungensis]
MTGALTRGTDEEIDPLASHGMKFAPGVRELGEPTELAQAAPTPFGLRWRTPVERPAAPEYHFDGERQIAVDRSGAPLAPQMDKDWTTTDYSTDGEDGPSSEEFGWEEL